MSFGIMGIGSAFINAAGRGGKIKPNFLTFRESVIDPILYQLSCTGKIAIESIKNGAPVIVEYTNLSYAQVSVQADADTDIKISGDVTTLFFAFREGAPVGNTEVYMIDTSNCNTLRSLNISRTNITSLDVSGNTALEILNCGHTNITSLDVSGNTALETLNCESTNITSLDVSGNTELFMLICGGCEELSTLNAVVAKLTNLNISGSTALTQIFILCEHINVAQNLASAITNATAADGTVYTDSAGAYYSTIADAATAKGWTIQQLPA